MSEESGRLASMASPTLNPERRQTPRTPVDKLAYINLDPNNGAVVLNVSVGGLCFHSVAPIQKSETIRFWFSEGKRRIEADGQLAWMDENRKTGGLRFADLSTEARLQIRDWTSHPATPIVGARSTPSLPPSPELSVSHIRRPVISKALPDSSAPPKVPRPNTKGPTLWSGFSAGLLFGILVSTLVAAAFLFHAYREFDNSLIQLNERLAARSQAQTASPAPGAASRVPALNPPFAKSQTQPPTRTLQPQQVKTVEQAPVAVSRAPVRSPSATGMASAASAVVPPKALPKTVEPEASVSGKTTAPLKLESEKASSEHIENSRAEAIRSYSNMYLEVGKFRDIVWADQATNKLEQLGFHATVLHKGHLLLTSYQVLVGPYSSDDDAKTASKYLLSQGFKPRSYERGSRSFWFPSGLTFHNGTHIPVDDCVVSWESYVTDAMVKFEKDGRVAATVEGKWVPRDYVYKQNAIVYQNNRDGSRTLLEIQFAGMNRALVFG